MTLDRELLVGLLPLEAVAPVVEERSGTALLARNKYAKGAEIGTFNSDRYQCKRFLSTSDRLLEKIRQLECSVGSYQLKGMSIPQEALALYITVNPRDQVRAAKNSLVKFAELVASGSTGHNLAAEVISQVHKSIGRKYFVDVDFDGYVPEVVLPGIAQIINLDAVEILRTRGGFHALVRLVAIDPKYAKTWHRQMTALDGVDINGDNMIPVPGCTQGGFNPELCPAVSIAAKL